MTPGVGGVVLAAGYSSRAGTFKMTCPLEGKTVIEHCVENMADVCDEIVVVGGYRIDLLGFLPTQYKNLRLVYNDDYRSGMMASVRIGLAETCACRVFITPGDCPLIAPSVYEKMLLCGGSIAVPVYCGMEGHPVLLTRAGMFALLNGNHESLRSYIHSAGYSTVDVDDAGTLIDFDTQDDYRAILALLRRKGSAAADTVAGPTFLNSPNDTHISSVSAPAISKLIEIQKEASQ